MCASAYSNVIKTPSCVRLCVHTRASGIKLYYYYKILQTRPINISHKLIQYIHEYNVDIKNICIKSRPSIIYPSVPI